MSEKITPFSARNRGHNQKIDNSFPESGRMAVLHLLYDLVDKSYVEGWPAIARELQRIGRQFPVSYDASSVPDSRKACTDTKEILFYLEWDKIFDFCERIHNHLAKDNTTWGTFGELQVITPKSEAQQYISEELERILLEENMAFEFSEGLIRRRGRRHTEDKAARAQVVLGDSRLTDSRRHYAKALQFFRHPSKPDYENCVKEAVCAVEAAGKVLFPKAKAATLGDLAKWLSSNKEYAVPKALIKTIEGVYAYRSGGNGIGHGGSRGGVATIEVAEYILGISASQIIYLVDIEREDDDIPF